MPSFWHFILSLTFITASHSQPPQNETFTVIVPPVTIMVATTVTTYGPDVTITATPDTPPSPQYTSPPDMKVSVLNSTNLFRWEHNASFLAWNDSLAAYAAKYSTLCIWAHSHGAPGENLARGYPDVISSTDAWGNERALYNFSTPTGFTEATGHFTQLVWKGTQSVGCAAYDCAGKNGVQGWFFVCEYWPPGNIIGVGSQVNAWFLANVQGQVNDGRGYDIASATAGASGVGMSWATAVAAPTVTASSDAVSQLSVRRWRAELVVGVVALLGEFAW